MQLGLYLHYPFCRNQCSYCDFYKERYCLKAEREFYHALYLETELVSEDPALQNAEIASIFIGGGTPSLSNLDLLADWLGLLKRYFTVDEGIEFSIECNPESVDLVMLQRLKELGVNRPLFGIQSFNIGRLKLLNRSHNPHQSQRAIYYANALGFTNFGVDMIFALPGQTSKMLSADLDQLLDLEPPHISFYQLTVEDGTLLSKRVESGEVKVPDQELAMAMYRGGCEKMTEEGYSRYEVSSFARPGFECSHNLRYWEGGNFLGMGPSAHSFIGGERFANKRSLSDYIMLLKNGILPRVIDESGRNERITEAIMLGLRTSRGISWSAFAERFDVQLKKCLNKDQYAMLVESGHLIPDRGSLKISDDGILLADEITRLLMK